ncbi:hypothetical protein [Amycolatopsis benzoatilytica]|uniref:hypothetical protein n=1 Tax=Amycolatopsis benzoatilytica TaxID=346045 RepID=UPI0003627E70|nr:hypothetical protein [Amycolatopsis benzoatilytica]
MTPFLAAATGFGAAAAAAALDGTATILESRAAHATRHRARRYSIWLSVDLLGWATAVVALRFLPVFAVQAVLATQIAFAAVSARRSLTARDLTAVGGTAAGLGLVAASATTRTGPAAPEPVVVAVLGGLAVLLAVVALSAKREGPVPHALLAGLAYGGSRVALRAVLQTPVLVMADLVRMPLVYLALAFTVLGIAMYATSLRQTVPAVPSAVTTMTGVVFPGALAILLLGDRVRPGWWWLTGFGVLLAGAGVFALVRGEAGRPSRV